MGGIKPWSALLAPGLDGAGIVELAKLDKAIWFKALIQLLPYLLAKWDQFMQGKKTCQPGEGAIISSREHGT